MQEFWFKHADNDTYMVQFYRGDDPEVTVPSSWYGCDVTVLMDDIFKGHAEITKVILPDTLTDIGGFVFDGCSSLKEIVLPPRLHTLWQYAFVRSSFEELVIPAGVREIVPFVFRDCTNLKKVTFLADRLKIMGWSFSGCTSLETVIMPENTQIHETSFEKCNSVKCVFGNPSENR